MLGFGSRYFEGWLGTLHACAFVIRVSIPRGPTTIVTVGMLAFAPWILATLILAPSMGASRVEAATWNVPHDRSTIQAAIDSASDGDVVQVAPGAYEGPIDFDGKRILIASIGGPSVTRITAEAGSLVVARSSESRETELRGFTLSGGDGTRIAGTAFGGAVLIDGASPTLSQCTIRGNRADFGGGIACLNGAAPRIDRCVLAANRATLEGGGLYAERPGRDGERLEIVDCDVVGNVSDNGGGAIFTSAARSGARAGIGSVDIVDSRFRWNRAAHGAGVSSAATSLAMTDVRFDHNEAARDGAGVSIVSGAFVIERGRFSGNRAGGFGAAISLMETSGFVGDSRFERNAVGLRTAMGLPPRGGGAIAIERCRDVRIERGVFVGNAVEVGEGTASGGALFCNESSSVSIDDVALRRNRVTGEGAAVASRRSEVVLRGVRAEANRASTSGGAIAAIDTRMQIENCTLTGNSAGNEGGAIATSRSRLSTTSTVLLANRAEAAGAGGALHDTESSWNHVTITRNTTAGRGSGLSLDGGAASIVNSIVRGNAYDSSLEGDVHAVEVHLDVRSCVLDAASLALGGAVGEDNLDVDPRFVSPGRGDVHLRLGSPCVDAGLRLEDGAPAIDAEGDPRIVDGDGDGVAHPDIGADELRPEIAARFGSVASATAELAAPLRVNGSSGNHERIVRVGTREPIRIEMLAPPAGPVPARFALYAFFEAPDVTTIRPQPYGLGLAGFALPPSGVDPANPPIAIWNNAGHRSLLGAPTRPSSAAPSRIAQTRRGVGVSMQATLQGIIQDAASGAAVRASLTNAVVVEIDDDGADPRAR